MKFDQGTLSLQQRLGQNVWTVPAILQARTELGENLTAQWSKQVTEAVWHPIQWGAFREKVARIAAGLEHLGLVPGERVGIMLPSSIHWDLVQMGVLAARGVVVGLDPNDVDENLDTIARRCGLAGVIVQDPCQVGRFGRDVRDQLNFVIHFSPASDAKDVTAYNDLLRLADLQSAHSWDHVQPDDPATIIFTSGTTGAPKGIQFSHRQLCLAVASILEAFPDIDQNSHLACWLPLSNMFQRIINLLAIACGAQTYYVEDPRSIMQLIGSIRPHLFIGVPRFYEKLYTAMMEKVEQRPVWQQALVAWAMDVGERYADAARHAKRLNYWQRLNYALADLLVLGRLRRVMGVNLRYMVSGSAPMPVWLLERFNAMGLLVLEAYGFSENAIPVAANRPDAYRFGTVGRPMKGCDVRLAEDGELLVRGPGVISSYYGEEQAELRDSKGYLASGDYATIDDDGFITLVGRKSEIIKTSTGRRIAPAGIESILSRVPCVDSAVIFGSGRPFLVAVVVISKEAVTRGIGKPNEPTNLQVYCEKLRSQFEQRLATLPEYKRPAGLVITTLPFTHQGRDLTINLKLRRQNIEVRYAAELETLYQRLEQNPGGCLMEIADPEKGEIALCSL